MRSDSILCTPGYWDSSQSKEGNHLYSEHGSLVQKLCSRNVLYCPDGHYVTPCRLTSSWLFYCVVVFGVLLCSPSCFQFKWMRRAGGGQAKIWRGWWEVEEKIQRGRLVEGGSGWQVLKAQSSWGAALIIPYLQGGSRSLNHIGTQI